MSIWKTYPSNYRENEVQRIQKAVQAGECVAVIGLSGAGKSNLLGFLANRPEVFAFPNALVDCNRLRENTAEELFKLIRRSLRDTSNAEDEFEALALLIERRLAENDGKLAILLDRFEILTGTSAGSGQAIASNLRALRDTHKYQLTFVTATRRPLNPGSELAELSFGHTLWLGPLSESDTLWNVLRYALRVDQEWEVTIAAQMRELTGGYPSLLRAVCEAYADGTKLDLAELQEHPAIQRRLKEFWEDAPSASDLRHSQLEGLPLLEMSPVLQEFDTTQLTEKEFLLLEYLQAHPNQVCSKDELVQAVWPEDVIYERGIRDDSLAQLVRRLRVKIEPDPSEPQYIHTIPGRGYRFLEDELP